MPHRITVLGPGHHLYFARRIDGYSSCLHLAELMDEKGRALRAYVKAFPASSKGIVNEAIGWLTARAVGLPCPPRAYILLMHTERLAAEYPDRKWGNSEMYPTFATEALAGTPIDWIDAAHYAAQIKHWPHLPAAIALHEALHNVDGNAGNLLALDGGGYATIDYGDILGGRDWSAKTLRKLGWLHNKLLHLSCNGMPNAREIAAIRHAASAHAGAYNEIRDELEMWFEKLLKRGDHNAASAFLAERMGADWMKGRL